MASDYVDALSSFRHWHVDAYVAYRRNSYVFANNFSMSYVFQFSVMEKSLVLVQNFSKLSTKARGNDDWTAKIKTLV